MVPASNKFQLIEGIRRGAADHRFSGTILTRAGNWGQLTPAMNEGFYSWGLPVGRIAGIRIKLHWLLLLFWAFRLDDYWRGPDKSTGITLWLIFVGLVFLSILLHELGHCFAARSQGGHAEEVLLWPLGGLAFVSAPYTPRAQLVVAAGGPLVTLLIALVAFLVLPLIGRLSPELVHSRYFQQAHFVLVYVNLFLLIFNLIPLYPLDGGRIFHAILWGFYERRQGHGAVPYMKATLATVWASRVTAVLGIIVALYIGWFILLIIFAWAWMGAEGLLRRLREGEGSDSAFGYDFSRGYTSLEDRQHSAPRGRKPFFFLRLFQARREPREVSEADGRHLDELLRKISREGMGSLSRKERRFLDRMSRKRHDET